MDKHYEIRNKITGGNIEMPETCDTCKWCEFRKYLHTGTIELYCENELSEKYEEPIRLNDTCDEWQEKE